MRTLMWFTIGFAAACFLGMYLVTGAWLILLFGFVIAATVPLFFLKNKAARITAVVLLGLSAGLLWQYGFDALYLQTARGYDGETVSAVATVSDYSFETQFGVAVDGKISLDGKSYKARIYLTDYSELSPGDTIQADFRLRLTTRDSLQGSTYHQGDGIFLLAYTRSDAKIQKAQSVPLKYYPAKLRREITSLLDNTFPADTLAFARALLLGDGNLLDYETDTAFKLSGVRHVIAVSGLHVSILFSLVYLVSGRRRFLTAILGIPVLFLFAAIAGFTPSVMRACIMQGLVVVGVMVKKEYDPPTALAFAVLTMLAVNPMTITSVSFQLSVGCVIGILLFYEKINAYLLKLCKCPKGHGWKARVLRWLCSSVSITLSAMVFTTPLSAVYFGTVSLVGIITNLLTLWIISAIFYGIMLACVAGAVYLPAGMLIARIVSWGIRYVQLVAKLMASVPFSAVYTCSKYIVVWLVFSYILIGIFLVSKKKMPGLLAVCIVLMLIACIGVSCMVPCMDDYRVTVFDVGQGQAVLVQSDGKHYLVDCGGDSPAIAADTVAAELLSQGINRLDGVILTHYDLDHAGGVPYLLTRVDADAIYLPDMDDNNGICESLQSSFGDRVEIISREKQIESESMRISLFPSADGTKGNESCMCILFQVKECDILITGDRNTSGEKELLYQIQLPELELLVVGHHGSASATGFELLEKVRPKAAVISVGADNYHGHPSTEVLKRLELFGCCVLRTDIDGTIIFKE